MTVLCEETIRKLCIEKEMITPWQEKRKLFGVSQGLSNHGYDVVLKKPLVFEPWETHMGVTIEYVKMPKNVMAYVKNKSTWARKGLLIWDNVIDAGYEGEITIRMINLGKETFSVLGGCGIAQMVFHKLDKETNPYDGKYQGSNTGEAVEAIFENEILEGK